MALSNCTSEFFADLKGKRVAICGIGNNNIPVVHQFLRCGAIVTACDRREYDQLGEAAAAIEKAGAALCLGEGYLDTLAEVGADMVIRTPGMKPYLPQFEQARACGIDVTSEMELFLKLCPAHVTAVTGSDGKTTTTAVIGGLLEAAGKTVHIGGNFGRALLPVLDEISAEDEVVVELSSFQLTMMSQSPPTAVITNVTPNHLDWHTDMAEYIEAKHNLIAWQKSGDRTVLNADNDVTAGYSAATGVDMWRFSRKCRVEHGVWLSESGIIMVTENGQDTPVMAAGDICIPGVHNVENYMAAIAAVWGKVSTDMIAAFAAQFGGVAHRCELVRELDGVRWYNDSIGSSPTRTMAGLVAFGKKVILIAGGYDKKIPYEPLGPVAADTVKIAILLGATAPAIEKSIRACSDLPVYHVKTMEQAVSCARELATDGDIVFLSPASASFDMYKNFEERGNHFRTLVNDL